MAKSILTFLLLLYAMNGYALDFLNENQKGLRLLKENKPQEAANHFQDPMWQGTAYYRANQFQQAVEKFSTIETADGFYNKGNALAQLNQIDEAIKAYEQALKLDPNHADAKYNLELLKKLKSSQNNQNNQNNQQKPPPPQSSSSPPIQPEPKDSPETPTQSFWKSVDEDPGSLLKQKFLRDYLRQRGDRAS